MHQVFIHKNLLKACIYSKHIIYYIYMKHYNNRNIIYVSIYLFKGSIK